MFVGRTAGESKMNTREALGYLEQLRDLWRFKRSLPALRQRYTRLTVDQLQQGTPARS